MPAWTPNALIIQAGKITGRHQRCAFAATSYEMFDVVWVSDFEGARLSIPT